MTEPSPATATHPPLQATVWKQVVQMNLKAREQASLDGSSYKPLSSLPSVGYQPSGAASDKAKTQQKMKASSEVIVLSDEESPTSSMESLKGASLISAHRKNATPDNAQQTDDSDVNKLRERLLQEEKRLRMLKQLRGRQHSPTAVISNSVASRSAKEVGAARSEEERPKISARQGKHNIVVVPGGQKAIAVSSSGGSTTVGISSRLQQLVDSIAADQALNSQQLGSKTRPLRPAMQAGQLAKTQNPPVPSLTSVTSVTASTIQKPSLSLPTQNLLQLVGSAAPPLRTKVVTSKRGTNSQEVITISDSPSPVSKPPPPLLPTPPTTSTSTTRVRGVITNGSIQVSTISSTKAASMSGQADEVVIQQAVENSRRYKDYLMKQSHVRRSFQKQMEKKIAMCPYPKTFRQVWPVVPVHDPSFIRNFGLEAIFLHLDPNLKTSQDKMNSSSRVKPICNQCGCDFASAWQIRKSNSKQLLLCEACDFTNLKILQRSKLANQMKELVDSIKKEEDKFSAECEEARKQVVALEKQSVLSAPSQRPPPLTSQLLQPRVVANSEVKTSRVSLSSLNSSRMTNNVIQASSRMPTATQPHSQPGSFKATVYEPSKQGIVTVNRSNPPRAVIPSILPMTSQHSSSKYPGVGLKPQSGAETENPRKRKEPPDLGRERSPPSKALKPGSALDQTLQKLTQQLIKRKLDEQRQEMQQAESGKSDGVAKESAESRKSRRKGTPRHKRHLSSSSVTSE